MSGHRELQTLQEVDTARAVRGARRAAAALDNLKASGIVLNS